MKIKNYSKHELALLYFPESMPRAATKRLMRWIYHCKPLLKRLTLQHYQRTDKMFTSRQVKAIIHFIGEP